jgi:hypothetical protein
MALKGNEGKSGGKWLAIYVYFRTVLSLPEVRSLLYQLKELCLLDS